MKFTYVEVKHMTFGEKLTILRKQTWTFTGRPGGETLSFQASRISLGTG